MERRESAEMARRGVRHTAPRNIHPSTNLYKLTKNMETIQAVFIIGI